MRVIKKFNDYISKKINNFEDSLYPRTAFFRNFLKNTSVEDIRSILYDISDEFRCNNVWYYIVEVEKGTEANWPFYALGVENDRFTGVNHIIDVIKKFEKNKEDKYLSLTIIMDLSSDEFRSSVQNYKLEELVEGCLQELEDMCGFKASTFAAEKVNTYPHFDGPDIKLRMSLMF